MNSSQRSKLDRILRNGVRVITMFGPKSTGVIYYNVESRGYKTGFNSQGFYYLVQSDQQGPFRIDGITKDARRHTFMSRLDLELESYTINDQALLDQWIGGKGRYCH